MRYPDLGSNTSWVWNFCAHSSESSFLRETIVGFMKWQLSLGSFLVWNYRIQQVEYCKVEGEFYERVHALECEFAERFKPLFEKVRWKYIIVCSNELWKSFQILTLVTTICWIFCASVISWYMWTKAEYCHFFSSCLFTCFCF